MPKLKIGIMGTGWPGRMHAGGLADVKGAKVTAVADPDPDRRADFVKTYGGMEQFDDYRTMLKDGGLDAVVIALPTNMHYKACIDSLKAGCHILCEKPPTTTAAEMKKIAKLAKEKKLVYMFARQPRYRDDALEARRLVTSGKIGHVYHAEAEWIRCRGIPWGKGGWFVNKDMGGGVLLDLGVHMIDNPWFVMGCPKPVEAFAGNHVAFSDLAPKGVKYTAEDMSVGMIRFDNGATLSVTVTFALNTPGPQPRDVTGKVKPEWGTVKVYGKKGGIDVWSGKLAMGKKDGVMVTDLKKPRKKVPEFTKQAKEFVRAVKAGDEPLNSAEQAVMLMQMLDALKKSGETRSSVRIR